MQKREREKERKERERKKNPRLVNMVRDKNRSDFFSFSKTSLLIKSLSLTRRNSDSFDIRYVFVKIDIFFFSIIKRMNILANII